MAETAKQSLSEKAIQNLEAQIPRLAAGATHAAFVRALAAGHGVLKVEGSHIVEMKADGSLRQVCETKPHRKVITGEVVKVRRISL
jgi:hypothetical protein